MVDDRYILALIRKMGGRVDVASLAWSSGVDEAQIFAALERLVLAGHLVESADQSGMVTP